MFVTIRTKLILGKKFLFQPIKYYYIFGLLESGVLARNCAYGKKAFNDVTGRFVNSQVKIVFVIISLICIYVAVTKRCAVIRTIFTHIF